MDDSFHQGARPVSDENPFENLFAEFDSTTETTLRPSASAGSALARPRGGRLWSRFVRWVVQGPGLVLALFLLYLLPLVKEPERGLNLPGALFLFWLTSGLLGKRPLAHPLRWLVLLLTLLPVLTVSATFVRCAIDTSETGQASVQHFTLGLLELVEKATVPSTLAWQTLAAFALFILTRELARRLPWVEPSRPISRFRKNFSMLVLGLVFGSLCALPVAYQFAWSRPWLASRVPALEKSYRDRLTSKPGDLGQRYPEVFSENFQLEKSLTPGRKAAFLRDAEQALSSNSELTQSELRALYALFHQAQTHAPSRELVELTWKAFARSAEGRFPAAGVTRAFRRQVLPTIANAPDPKLWRERLHSLPAAKVELETLDAILADEVRQEQKRIRERMRGRPFKLFGRELATGYGQLISQVDLTVKILLYQKERKNLAAQPIPFEAPGTYGRPLEESWNDVLRLLQEHLEQVEGSGNSIHLQDRKVALGALSQRESVRLPAP